MAILARATIHTLILAGTVVAAGCIKSSPTAPIPAHTPPPPTLTAVAVTGGGSGNPGQTTQLVATASFSDGSTQNVSQEAAWSSANPAVAAVGPGGVVTFVAVGEADIQAAYRGMSAAARVAVVPAPIPRRTLSGIVIDYGRRTGLPGARVEITDGVDVGRFTITAGDGSFALENIAEGTFTVRFSHPSFDPIVQPVTLTAATRVEVTLRPLIDVTPLYGTYGISLRVTQQACSTPVFPAATGTLVLNGNKDGSGLTVTITERGASRSYGGTMNSDGSFSGTGSGGIPGFSGPIRGHDFSGSIQGRVTGSSLVASEDMTYGAPCPGGTIQIALSGSR